MGAESQLAWEITYRFTPISAVTWRRQHSNHPDRSSCGNRAYPPRIVSSSGRLVPDQPFFRRDIELGPENLCDGGVCVVDPPRLPPAMLGTPCDEWLNPAGSIERHVDVGRRAVSTVHVSAQSLGDLHQRSPDALPVLPPELQAGLSNVFFNLCVEPLGRPRKPKAARTLLRRLTPFHAIRFRTRRRRRLPTARSPHA
jgi:hypothetical protein